MCSHISSGKLEEEVQALKYEELSGSAESLAFACPVLFYHARRRLKGYHNDVFPE